MILKQVYMNEEERFLIDILSKAYPDKDFEPGSNYNELIIKPMATLFASLKQYLIQSNMIANLLAYDVNSFNGNLELAMRATLNNWLMSPRSGTRATGFVKMYTYDNMSTITISNEARIIRNNLGYKINSNVPIAISPSELEPQFDENGNVSSYKTPPIPVIAESEGEEWNALDGSVFNLWTKPAIPGTIIKIEAYGDITGGTNEETPTSFTSTSIKEALSVRNLTSKRSIISSILSNFPDVADVIPVGYKDPEMTRNKIVLYNNFYRVGGCDDIYIFRSPSLQIKSGTVGESVEIERDGLPDNKFLILDDIDSIPADLDKAYVKINLPYSSDYMIKGYSDKYIINKVVSYNPASRILVLEIAPSCPEPYDFLPGEISIGVQYPDFNDMISNKTGHINTTASTGNMILIKYPVSSIENAYIYDPGNSSADPSTGFVKLTRVTGDAVGLNEYSVYVPEKDKFNSYGNHMFIRVNQSHIGKIYKVEYMSFNIDDVAKFVIDDENSILAIDRLIRAKYSANVSLFIQCSMMNGKTLDVDLVKRSIVNLVNSFDFKNNEFSCDLIKTILYNSGAEKVIVGANYSVTAPTGRIVRFYSEESIKIHADNLDKDTTEGDMTDLIGVTSRLIQFYIKEDNIRIEIV